MSAIRTIPGPRLALLLVPPLLAVALFWFVDAGKWAGPTVLLLLDGTLLVVLLLEARWLRARIPTVTRHVPGRLIVGVDNPIELRIQSHAERTLRLTVRDGIPAGFKADPDELSVVVAARGRSRLSYTLLPNRRGDHALGNIHVRLDGALGLAAILFEVPAAVPIRVYPNVLGPRRFELAAKLGDLRSVGFRAVRRKGQGGDFEQLREYVQGDSYRDLDWKATAKRRRPVTRVFQDERSQPIMIAIDAGRAMATEVGRDDALSKLDHAINAALLLAYVALRKGDRVGLLVFDDEIQGFLPPSGGVGQYARVLELLYRVQCSAGPAEFQTMLAFLQVRVPRRALLVLFTDLTDPSQSDALRLHAGLLRRKHLPLCIIMRDPKLAAALERSPTSEAEVFRQAAAVDLWLEQQQVKAELRKQAVDLLEVPASELSTAAVNQYLKVKAGRTL